MEIKTGHIKCSSCGAPLSLPEGPSKNRIKCPFCSVENFIVSEDVTLGGINFELSEASIHKRIIEVFSNADFAPFDIFTESSVKKINKLVIPAYLYVSCTGVGSLSYEKGVKREVTYSLDDREQTNTFIDWHPMSLTINDIRDYLVAGNKNYTEIFKTMFGDNRAPEIVKAENLNFPNDATEINYDLTEGDVYGKALQELVNKSVTEKGNSSVEGDSVRNIHVDGITIQKGEVRKVSVAVYEVILEYKGTEFKIFLSNDEKASASENLPVDTENKTLVEGSNEAYNATETKTKNGMLTAIIVLIIVGVLTLFAFIGFMLLIVAGILIIIYIPMAKESNAKFKEYMKAKDDYVYGFSEAKLNYLNSKVALKGILSNLSGNPDAFPAIDPEEVKKLEDKKAKDAAEAAKAAEKAAKAEAAAKAKEAKAAATAKAEDKKEN